MGRESGQRSARMRHLAAAVAVVGALVAAGPATAATFRPTRLDDPKPNGCHPHDCSLREAVAAADKTTAQDTIVLTSGRTYELRRTPSDLVIHTNLVIEPDDRGRATIDANKNGRVFNATDLSEPNLLLKRLILRHGRAGDEGGGAVLADVLKIRQSLLAGNHARNGGAIDTGFLYMSHSLIAGNKASDSGGGAVVRRGGSVTKSRIVNNTAGGGGGGLWLPGPYRDGVAFALKTSTVAGNEAGGPGGGVLNEYYDSTIVRSTISGNHAGAGGGGISNVTVEDLDNQEAGLEVTNSTVATNRADGPGGGIDSFNSDTISLFPPVTFLGSVTIAGNEANTDNTGGDDGGGINVGVEADYTTQNTIVGGNSVGTGGSGPECSGDIGSMGDNIVEAPTDCTIAPGDLVTSPLLTTLGDHGGPTKTIGLRAGSPAINAATDSECPDIDQRGVKRVDCDIGAFERR